MFLLLQYTYIIKGENIVDICICDDEKSIHTEVKTYLNMFQALDINITDTYSGEDLLIYLEKGRSFDIVFLDIELKQLTGLYVAQKIRKIFPKTIIIFISNYPNYVFDAFSVEALHFLVKPLSLSEFKNVFDRAINKYTIINSTISLKWQSERYIIKIDTIKYIEGYKRHIIVYTEDGIYESLGKIPDLLKELSPHGFIRTHQGFIVNMDYIKRFDLTDVVLFDGTKVMISVRKRSQALKAFDNYLKNRKW